MALCNDVIRHISEYCRSADRVSFRSTCKSIRAVVPSGLTLAAIQWFNTEQACKKRNVVLCKTWKGESIWIVCDEMPKHNGYVATISHRGRRLNLRLSGSAKSLQYTDSANPLRNVEMNSNGYYAGQEYPEFQYAFSRISTSASIKANMPAFIGFMFN